jgi:superfamily II DNA helicase RecQ
MAGIIKLGKKKAFDYPKSIKEIDELTGEQFEMFVFKYLKDFCDYAGEITEKNDYGVDIILWKKEDASLRYGVQCKRYGPKTILGENDLMKMQKGVRHYGISEGATGKPNLILFTSAEQQQVTGRGIAYIENEEIEAYYRDDVIEILKDLDEKLKRNVKPSNYSSIAFESSKKKKESFKTNSKFVDMLKIERKNISKFNKITPIFMVYNDKTLKDLINKKPTKLEELLQVKGFNKKKVDVFGFYLVNKIREFMNLDKLEKKSGKVKKEINKEEFIVFLKVTRKKIFSYNKIDKIYNVFNNKTMDEIAELCPTNTAELLKVNGISSVKVKLWGNYLISEINNYLKKQ